MTELEAARQIAEGKLPSPYKFSNMTLFALRVTGTGMAYRESLEEFVWRDPGLYLNDEFLARVAGLPLIWEHPTKGSLNSKEFGQRIIGTMMFGYIDGDEVWGVARVYDDEAIELMTDGQLSTSPGVVFGPADGNISGTTTDGETLLIEGKPSTLCHLAVCEQGVWDKGKDPSGILNDTLPQSLEEPRGMADEDDKKADAEKSRHDADEKKWDAVMDAIRSSTEAIRNANDRLDAFEKEKNDAKRHDAARKDKFGHRKDGESYKDWAKRHDADEKEMADALKKHDGAKEEDCMDAARGARHDAEEDEKRHDKDFDKWAKEEGEEPEHKEDKKRKDASFTGAKSDAEGEEDKKEEEKEEKAEKEEEKPMDSRKDSAAARENRELKDRLARLEGAFKGLTTEIPSSERDAMANAQNRADSVLAMMGDRAPPPMAGELSIDYRRRILKRLAPHSEVFRDSRFAGLDAGALSLVEDKVYADAANSAKTVADATPGMLIPIEERDRSGRMITRFHGPIEAFLAPFVPHQATVGRINRNPKGIN